MLIDPLDLKAVNPQNRNRRRASHGLGSSATAYAVIRFLIEQILRRAALDDRLTDKVSQTKGVST
jgi:hypothetical protein